MNKLAIAAAALLVLALLGLPRVVGSVTEARVAERVAAIDASPTAAATVTSFERGWFHSTARIELRFVPDNVAALGDLSNGLALTETLPIAIDFAHGPIAILDGVHFGWSKMVAHPDTTAPGVAELQQALGVPYLFEFRGRSSYWGGLEFDADAPPFVLPIDEGLLTFSGATLDGHFAGLRLAADAQVGSLQFTSSTGTVAARGIYASMDNELRSEYVMPGVASFTVESVSVSNATQGAMPVFDAVNLRMTSDVALDPSGELLEMRVGYDVDSLRLEENSVTAGAVSLALRNIDVAALEAYSATATDAAAAGDPALIRAALGPHLERALKAGPSLTLAPIRFRYDDEPFEGRIEIMTNAARLPPAGTLTLENPLLLLGLVNIDADLRTSKPLAGELATLAARLQLGGDDSIPPDQLDYMAEAQSGLMLTMLVGQGVLIEDGDGYHTSLQLHDGALTLNGNPLPFGL
jgi:uncharacterized protein YdgA (DUF945 family)